MIWTDAYLNNLLEEADLAILDAVDCIYTRKAIATTIGISTYDLPSDFSSLLRITWKGLPLASMSFREMMTEFPNSARVSEGTKSEYSIGRPQFYCMHPTFSCQLKLIPTPNEALVATGDVYGSGITDRCIISYWGTGDLPDYIARRTKKAYAMWRAFSKEGKGQNKAAAKYFKKKYDFLLEMFKKINSGVYLSRETSFSEPRGRRDPILPANFERVHYQ
jgi:hypothetical protein